MSNLASIFIEGLTSKSDNCFPSEPQENNLFFWLPITSPQFLYLDDISYIPPSTTTSLSLSHTHTTLLLTVVCVCVCVCVFTFLEGR